MVCDKRWWKEKNVAYSLPMYCEVNFVAPIVCDILTSEYAGAATAIGPENVLGTTPGNS